MKYHWVYTALSAAMLCASCGVGELGEREAELATAHSIPDHSGWTTGAWESRGPGGGGALFSPSINPHDPDELFMATDMSAVFHSRDFGRSWETLSFRTIQGGFNSQLRFTSDPRIVYAIDLQGTFIGAIRTLVKSSDGGVTWNAPVTTPGTPGGAYFLFVDPHSTQRILYTDASRVFFSCDGGQRFTQVHASSWEGGMYAGGAFWQGQDIYLSTSDGMVVSHDGGAHFALDPSFEGIGGDESMVSFAATSKNGITRFYAVTYYNRDENGNPQVNADTTGGALDAYAGVYALTLPDRRWTALPVARAADEKFTFVAAAEAHPEAVYVAGGSRDASHIAPIIRKTCDGGQTWQDVFRTVHNENIATGWSGDGGDMSWEFGEYPLGFAVSPRDPDRVMLTDLGFVHVSANGGRTFQQAYVTPGEQNPAGADTPPSRYYRTSGVEQTSYWYLTWADDDTIFASVSDIRSARSIDGGRSWSRDGRDGQNLNTTYHVIRHPRTGLLYGATSSVHDLYQSSTMRDSRIDGTASRPARGRIIVSADKGATWTVLRDMGHPVVWLALDPRHDNLLYASVVHSVGGGIYRLDLSIQDAPVKLPAPPRTKGHPFNVHVLDDGTLVASYAGHQDGSSRVFQDRAGVFVLPPGASAWEDRSDPAMHWWTMDLVIDPFDRGQCTWYAGVSSHTPKSAQGNEGGLYRTTDRGRSWTRISDVYRAHSLAIDPRRRNHAFLTTQMEGLLETQNLHAAKPIFRPVEGYPFRNPTRVFFHPTHPREVWATSFGGGLRVWNQP
jgi:photosystem II stability/assembly factor-like uncharacterized protein